MALANGNKSIRSLLTPSASKNSQYFCLVVGHAKGLFFNTKRELGIDFKILHQTRNTSGVCLARALKDPKVMYPFEIAGGGDTFGASQVGV